MEEKNYRFLRKKHANPSPATKHRTRNPLTVSFATVHSMRWAEIVAATTGICKMVARTAVSV